MTKTVIDRLCMSLALISIRTTDSCWQNSIQQIIEFGSTNALQCHVSLVVLKHICEVFENEVGLDRRTKKNIEQYIRDNLK